ncbi:MAG: PAS domain-containing protein [Gemmatimonadaceae bacterium]|nr:PAS domain-containing protein [Gemmatimonadaceae bacterium]
MIPDAASQSGLADRYLELLETLALIVYRVSATPPFAPLFVSRGIETLGYTREEWLSEPDNWVQRIHPDDRDRIFAATEAALTAGSAIQYEYRMIAKDGTVRWFHDRGSFAYDGSGRPTEWRGVMEDVTDRHDAEVALRLSESSRRAVFDQSVLAITIVDADGRFLEANDAFVRFIGYSLSELHGFFAYQLSPADDAHISRDAVAQIKAGENSVQVQKRFVRKDGVVRLASLTLVQVEYPESPGAMVGLIEDITERRQTEDALRESREELLQTQRLEMIGRLAGGVAHDFNNLLTVITSHAHFALDAAGEDPELRNDIEQIQRAADRAALLTRQLLAFGRRQVLQPIPLDVNDVLEGVEGMLRRVLPETVVFTTAREDGLPLVFVDRGQLEQVLINIIINARDAMPEGGLLVMRTSRVTVAHTVDAVGEDVAAGKYIRVTLQDTGVGMDLETQKRAFEPFFTTKPFGQGTGLGLSTVLGIVKQSGGFITVETSSGSGSTFHIHLPVATATRRVNTPSSSGALTDRTRQRGTIVLVEDEAVVRAAVNRILTRLGYSVHEATNGVEGESLIQYLGDSVDLVISDIVMPAMGGIELARRLKVTRPELPILLLSGHSEESLEGLALADGRCSFLAKPFSLPMMESRVASLVAMRR